MPYLLAAEADKIQDFIFRSSRLREVVGASQLLTRFCRSIDETLAQQYGGQVVVNDGGSFRVIFDDLEMANAFGADLAELYRLSLGGSLSLAEPTPLNGDFRAANDKAGKMLRQTKNQPQGAVADPHMPYVAFCASCGISLADQHGLLPEEPNDSRERYLCNTCQIKAQERWDERLGQLREFLVTISGGEDQLDRFVWPKDTDTVADYDLRGRNYVAYLVADGNGMGTIFSQCDESQIRRLSEGLTDAARNSLAASSSSLIARLDRRYTKDGREIVPVLPLILGGDDLFALIPAPYALDFARRFCLAWEDELAMLVKNAGLQIGEGENQIPRPTVATAVVICKSKYPYALAHRRAEELLEEAKRHSKLLAAEKGEHLSAVNFEVILGNRLAGQEDVEGERTKVIRTTLRPYWVCDGSLSQNAAERGIELRTLLAHRLALKDIPNKRLAELRRCFEDLPESITVQNRDQIMQTWTNRRLDKILNRLGKTSREKLEAVLAALGKPKNDGNDAHHWRQIRRGDASPFAHGMLDLLEVWDFAQDLDHAPDAYEPQEEEE
jgi:hypothetical protein